MVRKTRHPPTYAPECAYRVRCVCVLRLAAALGCLCTLSFLFTGGLYPAGPVTHVALAVPGVAPGLTGSIPYLHFLPHRLHLLRLLRLRRYRPAPIKHTRLQTGFHIQSTRGWCRQEAR